MVHETFDSFKKDFQTAYPNVEVGHAFLGHMYYAHGLKQGAKSGLTIGLIEHLKGQLSTLGSVFDGGQIFVDERKKLNRWKIQFNDCFILGGVHSHGNFTLTSPQEQETWWREKYGDEMGPNEDKAGKQHILKQLDFVEDVNAEYVLRVTQRELLALDFFGYTGNEEEGRMTFACTDANKADAASLVDYKSRIASFVEALKS